MATSVVVSAVYSSDPPHLRKVTAAVLGYECGERRQACVSLEGAMQISTTLQLPKEFRKRTFA
jgi:hypothetical protein